MNKKRKSAEDDEVETRKSSRQASNSSSTILPQICIFCGGDSKYKKKDKYESALEMLCTAQS